MSFTQAAINAEADKAGAAGNSDLMAKLKAAATNKKIQGAFMDVKNNGVSAAMKYKDDGRALRRNQLQRATRHRRDVGPVNASARWRGTHWFISAQPRSLASSRTSSCRERGTHDAYGRRRRMSEVSTSKYPDDGRFPTTSVRFSSAC